jgi:CheY-like chemotaxis protein
MENPKTLFLIDDDADDLEFFCEAVSAIDQSIICFKSSDSERTLRSFQNYDVPLPDLIFLDLNMPLVDGRTFLTELKKLKCYANVPVVIYSTSAHPKDIEETRKLGAAHFLMKPYSQEMLVHSLNAILSSYTRELV